MRTFFSLLLSSLVIGSLSAPAWAADPAVPGTVDLTNRNKTIYGTPKGKKAPARGDLSVPGPARPALPSVGSNFRMNLLTDTSIKIGAQMSAYHYQEPSAPMQLTGLKYGAVVDASVAVWHQFFARVEGRFATGGADYSSSVSGHHNDEVDNLAEARLLLGRDFLLDDRFSLSPFSGIGYRSLYNDGRGATDTGSKGYRRFSQYVYAPFGVTPRFLIDSSSRLNLDLEYDHLIRGKQTSEMSDAGVVGTGVATPAAGTYSNFNNQQYGGYGLRAALNYETKRWSFGPYVNYWNINQSKATAVLLTDTTGGLWRQNFVEPHNQTLEYGAQVKFKIW